MRTLLPLDQWTWPAWIEELAGRSPNPDRHASIHSPDAFDWVACGLPTNPDHVNGRYLIQGLPPLTKSGLSRIDFEDEDDQGNLVPSLSWDFDLGGPSDVDVGQLSDGQRHEAAFLVAMRRGANPWSWEPPIPQGQPFPVLGQLIAAGFHVAARAMLSHPACPDLDKVFPDFRAIPVRHGPHSEPVSLLGACAHMDRLEAASVLIQAGANPGSGGALSALALARSPAMVDLILSRPGLTAHAVVEALLAWHRPPRDSLPFAPPVLAPSSSALPDLVDRVRMWWLAQGLGGEKQWGAQLSCIKALCAGPISTTSSIPQSQFDEWARQVGVLDGPIWLPGEGLGQKSEDGSLQAVPAPVAHKWLLDRSNAWQRWDSHQGEVRPGTPWDEGGQRVGRLRAWKGLEHGLGEFGDLKTWNGAWSRFWSWPGHISEWTVQDAHTARQLWQMDAALESWPAWDVDALGVDVLEGLSPDVRQSLGEAFLLSMVESRSIANNPRSVQQAQDIGMHSFSRVKWVRTWLQTPGFTPPALTLEREVVLSAWPVVDDERPERLISLWRDRLLECSLPLPRPNFSPSNIGAPGSTVLLQEAPSFGTGELTSPTGLRAIRKTRFPGSPLWRQR